MISKLRGRSLSELRSRLAQQARAMAERRGFLPDVVIPAGMVLAPVTPWPVPDAIELRKRLPDPDRVILIARADRIVAGTFDVLGLQGVSYGTPVKWQRDPLAGREATLVHWSRVPYLDHTRVGDHKITWELNRHQWFVMLGQAWLLTGDARYASTAARLLREWLDANPPKCGINWVSALELSFRVQSWIYGLHFFGDAGAFDARLRADLVASAALQVDHIVRNLSTWFSPNTHLTGEALAILSAGCAWPDLPYASQWRALGWTILCDELGKQVRTDGVYFEQSAWYQAYTLDFYLLGMSWARHAALQMPASLPDHVHRAAHALRAVTRPDGTIARLGDDDGGRTLPLTTAPFGDMTDSLWRAAMLFDDDALRPPTDAGRSALLWLDGCAAFDRCCRESRLPEAGRKTQGMRDGGWVVLTELAESPADDHWLVFDAGPHGALSCAHSHADALSIDLSIHGIPVLVDPGTGAYAGEMRPRYRSTSAHNTVTVDGADSSEQGASFSWRSAACSRLEGFGQTSGASFATATHDGYQRLADPVRHRRTILRINRRYWLMFDALDTSSEHHVSQTFQVAPGVRVSQVSPTNFTLVGGALRAHIATDPRTHGGVVERAVSPAYGLEVTASAIVVAVEMIASQVYCTAIAADDETRSIATQYDAEHCAWRISYHGGADLVAYPANVALTLGPARFDGTVLVLLGGDEAHTIVAAGAGTLHLADLVSVLGADDVRIALRGSDGTWTMES